MIEGRWIPPAKLPRHAKIRVVKFPFEELESWALIVPSSGSGSVTVTSFPSWEEAHATAFKINDFRMRA